MKKTAGFPAVFVSALFVKFVSAAGASHHDVTLSPGNADLLIAAGAFVNVIILELGHVASQIGKASHKLVLDLQKLLVLLISLGDIPGEHSPVKDHKKSRSDQPREGDPYEESQDNHGQEHSGQEPGQAVHAVSSLHKLGKPISQFIKHRLNHDPLYIIDQLLSQNLHVRT